MRRRHGSESARPKKTPAEIVGRLNKEINSGLADPTFKARLLGLGVEPKAMTSDEFSKFVMDETEKWGKPFLPKPTVR
jgi:tripartite-type tricarboxylate transporter receptor subunit TctC